MKLCIYAVGDPIITATYFTPKNHAVSELAGARSNIPRSEIIASFKNLTFFATEDEAFTFAISQAIHQPARILDKEKGFIDYRVLTQCACVFTVEVEKKNKLGSVSFRVNKFLEAQVLNYRKEIFNLNIHSGIISRKLSQLFKLFLPPAQAADLICNTTNFKGDISSLDQTKSSDLLNLAYGDISTDLHTPR